MYDLVSGLSSYLQHEHGLSDKLMSKAFSDIRNTLDNVMKERAAEGISGREEHEPVMEDHEQVLWDKGILGEDSPDKLRKTIFFLCGIHFGLQGIKEQYDLRWYPDSQINIIQVDSKDALIFHEFQSKTNQGGIKDRGKPPPKVHYAFCSGHRPRCFVKLFHNYLFLGPKGSYNWPRFYVQTNPNWSPGSDYWYTNCPVGKNMLGSYIQSMMSEAGVQGNFRNHSLRKGTVTRLFRKGVDPDLIKETTGHRSDAIMLYKKSDLKLKKQVSNMLSILPREMESIRVSQEKMIEKETKLEQVKVPENSTISKPKDQISEETDKKSNPVKVKVKKVMANQETQLQLMTRKV